MELGISLYRRRYIPDETVCLSKDEILFRSDSLLVTKWKTLKPRNDFCGGFSCYFTDKGFKISKILNSGGNLVYYYCDIIKTIYEKTVDSERYIFCDLLADVIVYPDGFVKVVDIGEFGMALDAGLINIGDVKLALCSLDSLLDIIYSGGLHTLTQYITKYENF